MSTSSWGRELKYRAPDVYIVWVSRPPREVVSWNTSFEPFSTWNGCRPPREVVSWNTIDEFQTWFLDCRPPREVVSWNIDHLKRKQRLKKSTSSWGRELKWKCCTGRLLRWSSTSSWGRELKCIQYDLDDIDRKVDLLVRSWVEIKLEKQLRFTNHSRPPREVVSWNAGNLGGPADPDSRPPREVVSWNDKVERVTKP